MDINIELVEKQIKNKIKYTNQVSKQSKTSICLYDFFCINSIKICEKIKETPNLLNKHYIINNYSLITLGEVSERIYHYNTNNPNKYVLLEYNDLKYIEFNDFLFNLPNPKLFIFHILDSYSILLNNLSSLEQIGIRYLNISTKKMLIKFDFYKAINRLNDSKKNFILK